MSVCCKTAPIFLKTTNLFYLCIREWGEAKGEMLDGCQIVLI